MSSPINLRSRLGLREIWPLGGRADQLAAAAELLAAEKPRSMVIVGAAGSGRTRLGLEILRSADERGFATARTRASAATRTVPLGALSAVLRALGASHTARGASDDIDELGGLMRHAARCLVDAGSGGRLALFIDDAHDLDEASAALVYQLVADGHLTVVATVLADAMAPPSVIALWKDDLAERMDLPPLTPDAVEELLAGVLGAPLDRASVTELLDRSGGNPLYLRELLLTAVADGMLHQETGGVCYLAGSLRPSRRLTELVAERLQDLSPGERALLETIAAGEPLRLDRLAALTDVSIAAGLEETRLIDVTNDVVRVAHPVVADVVRAHTPALRARVIAAQLADAFERTGMSDTSEALRVVTWRMQSGDATAAQLLDATRTARARTDFTLAEQLVNASIALEPSFEAKLLSAEIVGLQGRTKDSEAALMNLMETSVIEEDRVRATLALMDNEAFFVGQPQRAVAIAEKVAGSITDVGWRREILARRSVAVLATHGPQIAAALAEPLLGDGGPVSPWACLTGSFSLGRMGRLHEAIAIADRGSDAYRSENKAVEWYPWFHVLHQCDALAHLGRIDEAAASATEHYRSALESRSIEGQACFALSLAKLVSDRGFPRSAARYGREAVALFAQLGRAQLEYWSRLYLAWALALGGDAKEADAALAGVDSLQLPDTETTAVDLMQARAWVAVAHGNSDSAHEMLVRAARHGEKIGDLVGAASSWHGVARLGGGDDEPRERLKSLAAQIEGGLVSSRSLHADGIAADDPGKLLAASESFEAMGALALAADAAADSSAALERSGDTRSAALLAGRARAIVRRCEEPVTPALDGPTLRTRLTQAQRKIALAAVRGASNKAIAEELHLSVRTVETHLQRTYRKLGVASRSDLPAALGMAPG
jgi:DNA-binding NarL/FixJ family response regulator